MDKSIDPKVAEALQIAYRARDVIGLDAETAALVADRIRRVAYTEFFRFPNVRLNQINWPAELYAYNALVNEDPTLLREDYRAQMRRFVDGIRRPWTPGGSTNLGPTYRFHYQNNMAPEIARNLDSAEYANMTLHFLYFYDYAVGRGWSRCRARTSCCCAAGPSASLYGYWTHAGFMNWETGWSYGRWMKAQGLGLLAAGPAGDRRPRRASSATRGWAPGPSTSSTAGCATTSASARGRPAARSCPTRSCSGSARRASPRRGCSGRGWPPTPPAPCRPGSGARRPATPPPFYAFDADVGRLAVSTPALLDGDRRRRPRHPALRRHRAGAPDGRRRRPAERDRRPPARELRRRGPRPPRPRAAGQPSAASTSTRSGRR